MLLWCSSVRNASCSSEGSSETEEQMRSTPPRTGTLAGFSAHPTGCVLCWISKRGPGSIPESSIPNRNEALKREGTPLLSPARPLHLFVSDEPLAAMSPDRKTSSGVGTQKVPKTEHKAPRAAGQDGFTTGQIENNQGRKGSNSKATREADKTQSGKCHTC
jgi:hypothetical protein